MADAERDQRGVEQHSGLWSSAVSAMVRSLPGLYRLYLESGGLHPSGCLDQCPGPLRPSGECAQEPIYGWSCSVDAAVLVMWAGIVGVSVFARCVCSDSGSLHLDPKCHD